MQTHPPLGIKPKWLHDEHRRVGLRDAIKRRLDSVDYKIPIEWVEEYNELTEKEKERA